jgi:hypothetical protein
MSEQGREIMSGYAGDQAGTAAGRRGPISGQAGHQPFEAVDAPPSLGGHPHGKLSSWVLIGVVVAAFIAGGIAVILHVWWLLYACLGIVVAAIPVGKAIGIMNDTVIWGATPLVSPQEQTAQSVPGQGQQQRGA